MKILKIYNELLYEKNRLVIEYEKTDINTLHQLLDRIGNIDRAKDYDLKIEQKKKKRSLNANAYFFELCGQLAAKLGITTDEVYQQSIRECGVFEIVPIKDEAIKTWIDNWNSRGTGWICEDLGDCKNTKGYHNIKCYYGSSTYDSKQMSRIIDQIVTECKEQGIETITPAEQQRLLKEWGG